jgi:hypothetical protein
MESSMLCLVLYGSGPGECARRMWPQYSQPEVVFHSFGSSDFKDGFG